jgi:hypothetical protein
MLIADLNRILSATKNYIVDNDAQLNITFELI